MAKKPKQLRGQSPKSPSPAEPGPVAAQNVILERIEEQQRVVIEAVTMMRETLERKIDEAGRSAGGGRRLSAEAAPAVPCRP